jgi:hypothetical protein
MYVGISDANFKPILTLSGKNIVWLLRTIRRQSSKEQQEKTYTKKLQDLHKNTFSISQGFLKMLRTSFMVIFPILNISFVSPFRIVAVKIIGFQCIFLTITLLQKCIGVAYMFKGTVSLGIGLHSGP